MLPLKVNKVVQKLYNKLVKHRLILYITSNILSELNLYRHLTPADPGMRKCRGSPANIRGKNRRYGNNLCE